MSSAIMINVRDEQSELIAPKYCYIKQHWLAAVLTFCNIPDLSIP